MSVEVELAALKSVNNLHLATKTQAAAFLARQRLSLEPSVERATQALVFTTAQVDSSRHVVQAFPHLLEIAEIIGGYYPIAKEESERSRQEAVWSVGFEGRNGYMIALRDMYRSLVQMSTIIHDPDLVVLTLKLRAKLDQFVVDSPNDRDAIQFQIQEGKFRDAALARVKYEAGYGVQNPVESVVLSATVFAKAVAASTPSSWVEASKILSDLVSRAKGQPKLKKLIGLELAKKLANQVLNAKVHKREAFHRQLEKSRKAYDLTVFQELGKLRV